jgi:CHAT domain
MSKAYYTYRIRLSNYDRVQIEKRNTQQQSLGEPSGVLRYQEKLSELTPLLQLVKEGAINDSSQTRLLGEILFDVLFNDELRTDFVSFYHQVVQQEKQLFRVELDIDEQGMPELAALPWEFLCLPARANLGTIWVGTVPDLVFSRRRSQLIPAQPIQLEHNEKLRIALVVSAPPGLRPVEYKAVQEALEKLASEQANRVELLPIVSSANPEAIDTILSKGPHIFHFIGHGRLENESNQEIGQIAFVDPDFGEAMWIDADFFSELFNQHRPGVVMLQACEGATLSASQAFVGLASRVVQQNIPVVVAMQYEVSNATASRFSRRFYQQLAEDDPVDIAAQYGRRAVALGPTQYRKRDFATPVIFMRVQDGYLFSRQESKSDAQFEDEDKARIIQNVQQHGKYNLNIGKTSAPLHIGDAYNKE